MFKNIETSVNDWIVNLGFDESVANIVTDYSFFLLLIIISIIIYFITKKTLLSIIHKAAKKSKNKWDDALSEGKFFSRLSYLVPSYIIYVFTPLVLESYPKTVSTVLTVMTIYMLIVVILAINALLNALTNIYQDFTISKRKPIKGYVQVAMIIIYVIGGIIIISTLFGKNPLGLLGGLGAFSAVLLLVFKDPILGFVGGIQLSANKMVQPGDWISMPEYNADGSVIDIALTTVKVQNWDKTISTIPTYSLITGSFKNWRGMEESGGRRIKRSINIDMKSIKFCTPDMLNKFEKILDVKEYVQNKEIELETYNTEMNIDNSVLVNGRRQTNIGIFRAYLRGYLHNHPLINNNMTFLIRQLQQTEKGLPIEIYVFSKLQEWAKYEDLQSDIFDHVLAVIPEFDLKVFQNPTGDDFGKLIN
ncbi:MAG: mechanosensitive ion channel family protein [Bacteroidales bacterium]|nr:mechanosensitive ion channel family protein [Bacteroidales bacterium]